MVGTRCADGTVDCDGKGVGELPSMLDARIPSVKRRALHSSRVAERAGVVHRTSGNGNGIGRGSALARGGMCGG